MSFAIGAHGAYPEASKSFFISNKRLLLHTEFACTEDDDDNVTWCGACLSLLWHPLMMMQQH